MSSFEPVLADWISAPSFTPNVGAHAGFAAERASARSESDERVAMLSDEHVEAAQEIGAAAHEAGRQAGLAEAALRLDPVLQALAKSVGQLDQQRDRYLHAQQQLLVELAVAVAEKLIGKAVAADTNALTERIGSALALVDGSETTTVELSHADYDALTEALDGEQRFEALYGVSGLVLTADAALASGDVRVRGDATSVDARMSTLLARVREVLEESDS